MIHTTTYTDPNTGASIVQVVDTDAQTVTTTIDGGTPEVRPMTVDEVEMYVAIDANVVPAANSAEMRTESHAAVDKLIATVEALNTITAMTNATINQNPAAVIKSLTRECKTIARQANREARFTSDRLDDTDTGPILDV